MPDRPPPNDPQSFFNDLSRRLRELERQTLRLPAGADPLQTFDDGSPLGDTRFIDFGANLQATLIGDGFVQVDAAASAGEFDAIVDSSIAATDTNASPPIFKTSPGEALGYLNAQGFTRAFVLVRPGSYTEVADWTSPRQVLLLAAAGTPVDSTTYIASWIPASFKNLNVGAKTIAYNLKLAPTALTPSGYIGETLVSDNCFFESANAPTPFKYALSVFYASKPLINYMRQFADVVSLDQADWTPGGETVTLASSFVARGLSMGSGSATLTVGTRAYIDVLGADTRISGSVTPILTINGADSTNAKTLDLHTMLCNCAVSLTGTDWGRIRLEGDFAGGGGVTVPRSSGLSLDGRFGALDITGPVVLDGVTAVAFIGRGKRGSGHLSTAHGGASGTSVSFIDADDWRLDVAGTPSSSTGTHKPLSFDATSDNNVIVFSGLSHYANAYTDAGTNNRVLPEGAPGTGGHVIEDEGTPLTQRSNLNFVGAGVTAADAGGKTVVTIPATATIDGHVIEDEGTPLTQRANMNFVGAGVTATDAGGKTVVTIPSSAPTFDNPIESNTGDSMDQGVDSDSARADHRHSRHGDEILRLTRMI